MFGGGTARRNGFTSGNTLEWRPAPSLVGLAIMAAGIPAYFLRRSLFFVSCAAKDFSCRLVQFMDSGAGPSRKARRV
jgi:hypothetical protein